jgi:mannose-6-phosphate isomerase-like protein (cupin superfamily)
MMRRLLMKRFLAVAAVVAAFSFGLAVRPVVVALAQGRVQAESDHVILQSEADAKGSMKAQPNKPLYIPVDEIKRRFLSGPPQGKDRINNLDGSLIWDPVYRFSVLSKPYYDPPKTFASGEVSHWEGPEMHEDKTQIYIIIGGTGKMALGGQPRSHVRNSAEGQHSSWGPLEGATSYDFKPGDWIVIPPMTWHQALPDPGQTIVYGMVHIETRSTRP